MASDKYPVIELFGPTIQGEGALCGARSHFVRFGGCPRRCVWCDSMHAVLPEEIKKNAVRMTAQEIREALEKLETEGRRSKWVTLSGGDPLMWNLEPLVIKLAPYWSTAIETQGDFAPDWLRRVQLITVSPKPPSAGEPEKTNYEVLKQLADFIGFTDVVFKVVVFDDEDLAFALDIRRRFPNIRMYLSAGTQQNIIGDNHLIYDICQRTKWLAEKALKYPEFTTAYVLPQMHVLMWGKAKGV